MPFFICHGKNNVHTITLDDSSGFSRAGRWVLGILKLVCGGDMQILLFLGASLQLASICTKAALNYSLFINIDFLTFFARTIYYRGIWELGDFCDAFRCVIDENLLYVDVFFSAKKCSYLVFRGYWLGVL